MFLEIGMKTPLPVGPESGVIVYDNDGGRRVALRVCRLYDG